MPFGPGTYGDRGGAGLAGPARNRQGIPQEGVVPRQPTSEEALSELVQMLRGGQVGADRMLELLSMLAGAAAPQMPAAPQQAQQGQPQQQPQGAGSIAALLGG